MPTFKQVKKTYTNGEIRTCCVNRNSTDEEIIKYFLNQWFDLGIYPKEEMHRCIKVEILGEVSFDS